MTIEEISSDNSLVNRIAKQIVTKMEVPKFADGGVPIEVVVKVTGKAATWIRTGIEEGWFPIGYAQKSEGGKKTNFYISPKLLWEVTGYVYTGNE